MATRAPSLGRGCRAQRGGVGFLFAAKPPPLCLPPWGRLCPSILFFFTYTYIRFDNARKAVFSFRCLPHWGRRTASAVDRVLSYIVDLRRSLPALFHTARTLSGSLRSPPSPRGEGFVRRYCFSTYACIRFDGARKAVFSYHSLPHWGRGNAPAVDRVLSYIACLR